MRVVVVLLAALSLPGCTSVEEPGSAPLTERAVVAIALDHLPADTVAREGFPDEPPAPGGLVGSRLRYDEAAYEIAVYPDDGAGACSAAELPRCVDVASDEGAATLSWDGRGGLVSVSLVRDGGLSYVLGRGKPFQGDPREVDLHVDVERLLELLEDPRLRLVVTED